MKEPSVTIQCRTCNACNINPVRKRVILLKKGKIETISGDVYRKEEKSIKPQPRVSNKKKDEKPIENDEEEIKISFDALFNYFFKRNKEEKGKEGKEEEWKTLNDLKKTRYIKEVWTHHYKITKNVYTPQIECKICGEVIWKKYYEPYANGDNLIIKNAKLTKKVKNYVALLNEEYGHEIEYIWHEDPKKIGKIEEEEDD